MKSKSKEKNQKPIFKQDYHKKRKMKMDWKIGMAHRATAIE